MTEALIAVLCLGLMCIYLYTGADWLVYVCVGAIICAVLNVVRQAFYPAFCKWFDGLWRDHEQQ